MRELILAYNQVDTNMTEPNENTKDVEQPEDGEEPEEREEPNFIVRDRRFWMLDEQEAEEEEKRSAEVPSYVEQLQQQLAEKDKQLREYIAAYKTEVVEGLEKTKERLERDSANQLQQLRGKVTEPMMEVLEALERSMAAAQSNPTIETLSEGIGMVHLLMVQKLQSLGLQRVETVGHAFDPACHEAIAVMPVTDPAQDNIVVMELRPGFTLGDRLVRAAQVQVGRLG